MMNKKIFKPFAAAMMLVALGFMLSCEDEESANPNSIKLESFGPSPNFHGGQLRFIGKNLDKVTAIVLPGNVEITTFVSKSANEITLVIPPSTDVSGKVILKTSSGDIETKTILDIEEPILISTFSPTSVRPGELLTITGTYLDLVKEISFATNKVVTEFESQSETEIQVFVPEDAQSGYFFLSNVDEDDLQVFRSETELDVILPTVTNVNPATIKAGNDITLTGANLDLVESISFQGGTIVTSFVSHSVDEIVVTVPDNSRDGALVLQPASAVRVESPAITMVVPTITSFTPNPGKNGSNITITGTDLDLVTSVGFEGDVDGEIQDGGTETSITVEVPMTAVDGLVTLRTAANKSVETASELTLVVPVITSFTPTTVSTASSPSITITGTNLDIVTDVVFEGDWSTEVSGSETQIVVQVVPGSLSGKIKLITSNGTEIESSQTLTINPDVPNITDYPSLAFIGTMITLTGTNMNVPADVIFPGNKKATIFGTKSPTTIEVFVPLDVTPSTGKVKFVTTKNEVYESPEMQFKFPGVEPVQDEALVFFDFNGTGKDSWWGAVSLVNDGSSADGSGYGRINGSYNGWTDLFWRNGSNNFPVSIGTDVDDYVLKFDVQFIDPITGGNIKLRLQGDEGDFWFAMGPAAPTGAEVVNATPTWTTITVPISAFKDNFGWGSNSPTDLSQVVTFGMAFDNGASTVNFRIDNVRFHKIN